MTNTPQRSTPFQQLIAHIETGNEVKIGNWTISKADTLRIQDSRNPEMQRFVATLENERFHAGQPFEGAIAVSPTSQENLAGLLVDLTVEIHAKMESSFPSQPFSTPIGNAVEQVGRKTRTDTLAL